MVTRRTEEPSSAPDAPVLRFDFSAPQPPVAPGPGRDRLSVKRAIIRWLERPL